MKKTMIALSILMLLFMGACVTPTDDNDGDGPEINNIRVTNIDENTVQISWETSETADGTVYYGLSSINDNFAQDTSLSMDHEVMLRSLSPDTTYHYKIVSATLDERFTDYTDRFSTIPDTVPPVIIDLHVGSVTSSSITMVWETNELTNCTMFWKKATDTEYQELASDYAQSTYHSATVTGLTHLTDYHFFVMAIDLSANDENSDQMTVTTGELPDVIWVPETLTVERGDTFEVGVKLAVDDLVEFCSLVEFDYLKLGFLGLTQGPYFIENRGNQWTLDQNTAENHILLNCTWQIDYDGPTPIGTDAHGEGIIVYYRFRALNLGETTLTHIMENRYPEPPRPDSPSDTRLIGLFGAEIHANWHDCRITVIENTD